MFFYCCSLLFPMCCTAYALLCSAVIPGFMLTEDHSTAVWKANVALRVGRHYRRTIFALHGVWMAIATMHFAFHGDVGGWALSGVLGEWKPYDGTATLLGVSYDAVRRCTFAAYTGAATLHAVRRGLFCINVVCDYRVMIDFRAATTVPIFRWNQNKCIEIHAMSERGVWMNSSLYSIYSDMYVCAHALAQDQSRIQTA